MRLVHDVFLRHARAVLLAMSGLSLGACGGLADESKLPPEIRDPAALHTAAGALARYRGALATIPRALDNFLTMGGILTDELADLPAPLNVASNYTSIDSRQDLRSGFDATYVGLHLMRGQAREARGFVTTYAPDSLSPALAGHLYAVEGYAEVWLADLFCSGIPLSTVDFNGDYTLAAGSSTSDVYRHALVLFDSALAVVQDSEPFQHLAAVGKGRALLALGRYAEAAAAVAAVPDGFKYQVTLLPGSRNEGVPGEEVPVRPSLLQLFVRSAVDLDGHPINYAATLATPSVADSEGVNGLNYRTSNDLRTLTVAQPGTDPLGNTMYLPANYPTTGPVTYTVADWTEARLIEAEAALQANAADGQWLVKLNHLRQTAITPALPDTTDPGQDVGGTDTPRVDLLFRERAFWLFLTGHREGDLRRLIRPPYSRQPDRVYPVGSYKGGFGSYGQEIVAPVPSLERDLNPRYTGCINNGA